MSAKPGQPTRKKVVYVNAPKSQIEQNALPRSPSLAGPETTYVIPCMLQIPELEEPCEGQVGWNSREEYTGLWNECQHSDAPQFFSPDYTTQNSQIPYCIPRGYPINSIFSPLSPPNAVIYIKFLAVIVRDVSSKACRYFLNLLPFRINDEGHAIPSTGCTKHCGRCPSCSGIAIHHIIALEDSTQDYLNSKVGFSIRNCDFIGRNKYRYRLMVSSTSPSGNTISGSTVIHGTSLNNTGAFVPIASNSIVQAWLVVSEPDAVYADYVCKLNVGMNRICNEISIRLCGDVDGNELAFNICSTEVVRTNSLDLCPIPRLATNYKSDVVNYSRQIHRYNDRDDDDTHHHIRDFVYKGCECKRNPCQCDQGCSTPDCNSCGKCENHKARELGLPTRIIMNYSAAYVGASANLTVYLREPASSLLGSSVANGVHISQHMGNPMWHERPLMNGLVGVDSDSWPGFCAPIGISTCPYEPDFNCTCDETRDVRVVLRMKFAI